MRKTIYLDRIKNGILKPYAPIEIVKETATTAMVDANMGMGLYVGPYCISRRYPEPLCCF